jgi:NAD-dependent dihydropyrimidine dehydrogenase PreA subunit
LYIAALLVLYAFGVKVVCFLRNDLMSAKVDIEKCTGCESCVEACPSEAIKMQDHKAVVDAEACIDCAVCVDECPAEAITLE